MSRVQSFWLSFGASFWSMGIYLLGVAAGRRAEKRDERS